MPDQIAENANCSPDPVTVLPVGQCDRDAAADCLDAIRGYAVGKAIREGRNDRGFSVQAFAAHRARTEAEVVAEIVAWLRGYKHGLPWSTMNMAADAIQSGAWKDTNDGD